MVNPAVGGRPAGRADGEEQVPAERVGAEEPEREAVAGLHPVQDPRGPAGGGRDLDHGHGGVRSRPRAQHLQHVHAGAIRAHQGAVEVPQPQGHERGLPGQEPAAAQLAARGRGDQRAHFLAVAGGLAVPADAPGGGEVDQFTPVGRQRQVTGAHRHFPANGRGAVPHGPLPGPGVDDDDVGRHRGIGRSGRDRAHGHLRAAGGGRHPADAETAQRSAGQQGVAGDPAPRGEVKAVDP